MRNANQKRPADALFAAESERCSRSEPGRSLGTSLSNGWTSVYLSAVEARGASEDFEAESTPDQTLVVVTQGALVLSSFSNGSWRSARRTVGSVGLTPGGQRSRVKWRVLQCETFQTAHIYLPQTLFFAGAEELRNAGGSPRIEPHNAIALSDPIVGNIALALAEAQRACEPDFLATLLSQALVLRLLSIENPSKRFREADDRSSQLRGARLKRLLDFIHENYRDSLTLERLAAEAHLSRFHFVRAFKAAIGVSPHQYILTFRLECASEMLDQTEASVKEIAAACGFSSPTHLATAFGRHFSHTPSAQRRRQDTARDDRATL